MTRLVVSILLVSSTLAQAQQPTIPLLKDSANRRAFVSGFAESCAKAQEESSVVPEDKFREVCDCSARGAADQLNRQELYSMSREPFPKALQEKLDRVLDSCIEKMLQAPTGK
jgi:hypothetical protein